MFLRNRTSLGASLARAHLAERAAIAAVVVESRFRLAGERLVPCEERLPPLATDPPDISRVAPWSGVSVTAAGPFHPLQTLTNGSIVKDSKSRPFLSTTRVTSEGDPLATCILGPVGADMNCQEVAGGKPEALTGIVISGCTVMTQPTVKDFVFRIFDEFIKEWLAEKIVSLLDLVLKYFKIGAIPRAIVSWVAKKVVPKLIDWAEDVAKNVWDQIERASDRYRRAAPRSPVLTS
ncbi:hypothetical protein [Sorangium sp. So ce388]|uniref:hypothetical protein n=1 Tax=Sorangium sp. So ce388 TaxID=3133309 RepID=UPI003F5C45F5